MSDGGSAWDALYPDDAIRRAEELIVATISMPADPSVFLGELERLVDEIAAASGAGKSDVFIGIIGSLAGIAERAAAHAAGLYAFTDPNFDPDQEEPVAVWAGREVEAVARAVDGLRMRRDARGEIA